MGTGTSLHWFLCPGQEKKGEGVRGDYLHWWVQGSTSSPTGGWFEVLWKLECPKREICAHLDGLPKIELWSYVVSF